MLRSPQALATLAPMASVLLGVTIAMTVSGLAVTSGTLLKPFGITPRAVLAASLGALGIGVIVPSSFALWVTAHAWHRLAGSASKQPPPATWLVYNTQPDRPLHWWVLSVSALMTGLLMAISPFGLRFTAGGMRLLWDHFVWSALPLEMLHIVVAFVVAFLPLSLLGLATSCVHHLSCSRCRWQPEATAWMLVGGGVGLWCSSHVSRLGTHPVLSVLAASLPALLLSIVCAGFASLNRSPQRVVDPEDESLPSFSDRYPRLTRMSVVGVGGGAVCAVYVFASALGVHPEADAQFLSAALIALGVGMWLGDRAGSSYVRSVSAFGMACAASGVAVAIAAAVTMVHRGAGVDHTITLLSIGMIGCATAMGRAMIMQRVGSRSREGARMTARLLAGAAMTCWLTAPLVLHLVGTTATLVMLALSLLATGGILVVHDTSSSAAVRRVRLAFVFGAIGTMIALGSSASNPWRRSRVSSAALPALPSPGSNALVTPRNRTLRLADRALTP